MLVVSLAKYGPGTYTYQAGHNLILAHAKVYRLYESSFKPFQQGKTKFIVCLFVLPDLVSDGRRNASQSEIFCQLFLIFFWVGKVGIALNINWYSPATDLTADADAAERALQFMGGWFANPIFGSGDYPSIMKQKVVIFIIKKKKQLIKKISVNGVTFRLERRAHCKDSINRDCRNSRKSKRFSFRVAQISWASIITQVS